MVFSHCLCYPSGTFQSGILAYALFVQAFVFFDYIYTALFSAEGFGKLCGYEGNEGHV
jgi:hypothetical protein